MDIFFVISGFLITAIINKQVQAGSFSYQKFWLKRIRRIFPASFVCVVFSVIIFAFLLSPSDFELFGKSLFSLGLFSSNIFFWRETGYFSQNAEEFPLLHTWSLSVEEQFYFFLPLALIFLERFLKSKKVFGVFLIVVISFITCVYLTPRSPAASFYLLPTRAWELGLGSLLALTPKERLSFLGKTSTRFHGLSLVSVLLMVLPMFLFDKDTPFPSFYAAIPVLGAVLFIGLPCEEKGVKNVFFKPFTLFIGKISYSLYLWHWIVFVALKHASFQHPSASLFFIGGVASVFFATLSYLFVEEPVRRNLDYWTSKRLWGFLGLNTLVFVGVGLILVKSSGLPQRFKDGFTDFKKQTKITKIKEYCSVEEDGICYVGKKVANPDVFLWGDSHAQSYLELFKSLSEAKQVTLAYSIKSGCPPLRGVRFVGNSEKWEEECVSHNNKTFKFLSDFKGKVFLSFRYDIYFENLRDYEKSFMKEKYLMKDGQKEKSKKVSLDLLKESLKKTFDFLRGKDFFVIRQAPAFNYYPASFLNKEQILNTLVSYKESKRDLEERVKPFEEFLFNSGVSVIDTWEPYCQGEFCTTVRKSGDTTFLFYYDDDHLNIEGARLLENKFSEIL